VSDDPRTRTSRSPRGWLARRLRAQEDGFSLIEMIVTMSMSLVILAALLVLWSSTARNETVNAARYESIDDASRTLERMTREVREATTVSQTASKVTLTVLKRGLAVTDVSAPHAIEYDCSGAGSRAGTFACTRTDHTTGATAIVLDALTTSSVFSNVAGQPNLKISLSLVVSNQDNPIVVSGGASPRNCTGALSSCA